MKSQVLALLKTNNEHTVFKALSITVLKVDEDETLLSLTIDDRHRQHVGLVHGGIYALLAESAASIAAACTLSHKDQSVVALEINANHVRPMRQGMLIAEAKPLHKGQKTLIYEVRVQNEEKKLISIARCTLMVLGA